MRQIFPESNRHTVFVNASSILKRSGTWSHLNSHLLGAYFKILGAYSVVLTCSLTTYITFQVRPEPVPPITQLVLYPYL
jgi:hypothetical protein